MISDERPIVAILGQGTLAERVLAQLLEEEGYAVRLLRAPPAGSPEALPEGRPIGELLEGVNAVLLWPGPTLRDGAREAFVDAMRSRAATQRIPLLPLPDTLEVALQDELAVEVPLERQFARLSRRLGSVVATSAHHAEENEGVSDSPMTSSGGARIEEIGLPREPRLPPGYTLDLADPEVLTLNRTEGSVVARFSARGATVQAIEEEAWKIHRERSWSA